MKKFYRHYKRGRPTRRCIATVCSYTLLACRAQPRTHVYYTRVVVETKIDGMFFVHFLTCKPKITYFDFKYVIICTAH